ncbi:hypothetical protein [Streptomyces lasiicapitis]|uniref:hypothetical protein n=1 Tax=Streptomyces lasiicapitis TaxID=1923961 RepID=UPI00369F4217
MRKYATGYGVRVHADDLVTFGETQPILSVLDVAGFEVKNLFLIGRNAHCGQIIVESESRAMNIQAALEPAYKVTVKQRANGDWAADYSRRDPDGSAPNRFITNVVLKDGTVALKDGRVVRREGGGTP